MNKTILIIGGAGFIGINSADYYLKKKYNVIILDNFSRKGSLDNLSYLKIKRFSNLKVIKHDIRIYNKKLIDIVSSADIILHLAAQVAVTESVRNPLEDFEINIKGTLNILEATRKSKKNPIMLYSSTNKVYGNLKSYKLVKKSTRYVLKKYQLGVSEEFPLDFYSPYGCSKGAADQYVRDYSRIYGLRTIVFRQSCIYGPHQFGIEDQGWIAWFLIAVNFKKKIKIYGDGCQVRDLLYVSDLIKAYDLAIKNIKKTSGEIYNVGGGHEFSISIWKELEPKIFKTFGYRPKVKYLKERPGDQKYYVSNINKAKRDFNWTPTTNINQGMSLLHDWIKENEKIILKVIGK